MRFLFVLLCVGLIENTCCQTNGGLFSVSTGPWSECHRIDNSYMFYKTRKVVCMYKNTQTAPWYYCKQLGLHIPNNRTICEGVMPVDCVTTVWSEWNASTPSLQHRSREIILPPLHGGHACPHTYESKACIDCVVNSIHIVYQWKISAWRPCEPLSGPANCGHGVRHRNVTCINLYGDEVDQSFCVSVFKPHNFVSETCELHCECVVSGWSLWSECLLNYDSKSFEQVRTRVIINYPPSSYTHGVPCPELTETRSCSVLYNLTWVTSSWSSCTPYDQSSKCGEGYKYRYVYCQKSFGNHTEYVNLTECKILLDSPPITLVSCSVQCELKHGHLSQWTTWSQCITFHNCSLGSKSGYRFREKPSHHIPDEFPCSHSKELQYCMPDECAYPKWSIKSTLPCYLTDNKTCGSGFATRELHCINIHGNIVAEVECLDEKPPSNVSCNIPCANDCVVSEWAIWSSCCAGGMRERTRHVLAYGISNCTSTQLQQTEVCNEDQSCIVYKLDYSQWYECIGKVSTTYCSTGVQTRNVTCMLGNTTVPIEECPGYSMENTTRECKVCKSECIKSDWYYGPCSVTCGTDGYRPKYRTILWQGIDGVCKDNDSNGMEVVVEQCPTLPSCQSYVWINGVWSDCYLPGHEICGLGYKNRTVTCSTTNGHVVGDSYCLHSDSQKKPVNFKYCVIPCNYKCVLKNWSKFGPCSKSCGSSPGIRTRVRHAVLPLGVKGSFSENCPELMNEELHQEEACLVPECSSYQWIVSNWSSCISDTNIGLGNMIRTVACINVIGNKTVLINKSLCEAASPTPTSTAPCNVELPIDCKVSEWQEREPCSASCGFGTTTRYRTVLQPPNPLGRSCPLLEETTTCMNKSCVEIIPGEWTACIVTTATYTSGYCGHGKMFQNYSCYVDGQPHDITSCNNSNPFMESQDCYLPCTGDCVLSEWSEDVSNCSGCSDSASCNIMLTRKILRHPLPTGRQCESLTKTEPCHEFQYYWHTGLWLSCVLANDSHLCGNGVCNRVVTCTRKSDNKSVSDHYCIDIIPKPSHQNFCSIACPVDCIVSEFEPWSMCNSSCDIDGMQTRQRHILINSNEVGRSCPHLQETRSCDINVNHCYTYDMVYSEWGSCRSDKVGNYCGSMTMYRTIDCKRRNDGAFVHCENCVSNTSLQLEDTCSVDCIEDEWCRYSPWSTWSSCTSISTKNISSFSFRSRKLLNYDQRKNDCLSDQYETKECIDNSINLLSFRWQFGPWSLQGRRAVWCESIRDRNIAQDQACVSALRPSNVLCTFHCGRPFICDTISGYCHCQDGLELMHGRCLPTQGCMTDSHCLLDNMQCQNFTCVCATGYRKNGSGHCLKNTDLNSTPVVTPTSSNPTVSGSKSCGVAYNNIPDVLWLLLCVLYMTLTTWWN